MHGLSVSLSLCGVFRLSIPAVYESAVVTLSSTCSIPILQHLSFPPLLYLLLCHTNLFLVIKERKSPSILSQNGK